MVPPDAVADTGTAVPTVPVDGIVAAITSASGVTVTVVWTVAVWWVGVDESVIVRTTVKVPLAA